MRCDLNPDSADRNQVINDLKKATYLTLAYSLVEFVVGYGITHSLAMSGDSFHMLTDGLALIFMFWAYKLRETKVDKSFFGHLNFGWCRLELIGMMLNTFVVARTIYWIFREAYGRFIYQQVEVVSWLMCFTALLGFVVNITIFRKLRVHSHDDEGIKSVIACTLTDAISPLAIMISGLAMLINPKLYFLDSLTAIGIAALLFWSFRELPVSILRNILEAVPSGIDYDKVLETMKSVDGVERVTDLHIYKIGSNLSILNAHINFIGQAAYNSGCYQIEQKLKEKFHELENVHYFIQPMFVESNLP